MVVFQVGRQGLDQILAVSGGEVCGNEAQDIDDIFRQRLLSGAALSDQDRQDPACRLQFTLAAALGLLELGTPGTTIDKNAFIIGNGQLLRDQISA